MASDYALLIAKLNETAIQATDVTVSIECVLFDDGAFVGPRGNEEFLKLKASITAKHDLLKAIDTFVNKDKTGFDEILRRVGSIADEQIPIPAPKSDYEAYYNYFRKLQAEEVISSRQALGDDVKTISLFLDRLKHEWIIPYEQGSIPDRNSSSR